MHFGGYLVKHLSERYIYWTKVAEENKTLKTNLVETVSMHNWYLNLFKRLLNAKCRTA
jgi:hypothetical protein